MNILYIDGVGPWGGASRSLFEALNNFPEDEVNKYFVIAKGTIEKHYSPLAKDYIITKGLMRFDNTDYSYYRGIRWLVFFRELAYLPYTFTALYKARKKWGNKIDLIHVNELTEIFPLLIAKWLFKVPAISHVRSVTRNDPKSMRCRWLHNSMRKNIDGIIAIDETVRASIPEDIKVKVIHNSFSPEYAKERDSVFFQKIEKIPKATLTVGFVGNLLKSKGILELLEAAKATKDMGYDINYLIVGGETRKENTLKRKMLKLLGLEQNFHQVVVQYIEENELSSNVYMLGATFDIQRAYEKMDVVCFASHFNAPGRPVFEAAFSGVPSIVAMNDPKPDTLVNMETGIAIPPHSVSKLIESILYFYNEPNEVKRMGVNVNILANKNFSPKNNSAKILDLYKETLKRNSND